MADYAKIPVLSKVNIGGKIYYLKDADARKVIDTIYGDYLKSSDKTALQEAIDAKVAQTDYDTKVAALAKEDARIAKLVADETTRATGVETTLKEKLDAIEVDINAGTKIKAGEKLIQKNENKELFTDLTVDIKTEKVNEKNTTFIVIYGDSGKTKEISRVNANAFVKDGLLESATYNANTHILTLTFNTDAGKSAIDVDLGTLVDTYTAGDGLYFSDEGHHNFAIKIATGSEEFLSVDANGLKISGIGKAISDAKTELEGKISAEKTRAEAAELALDGRLDIIEGEGKGSIKAAVAAEQTRAEGAESALSGRIDTLATSSHTHANKEVLDGITAEKVSKWDNEVGAKTLITEEAAARDQGDKDTLKAAKDHAEDLIKKLDSENNGAHTHTVSASGKITPNLTKTEKYLTASAAGVDLTVTDSDTFVKAVGKSTQGLAVAEYVNSITTAAQTFNDITLSVGAENSEDAECLTFVQTSKSFDSIASFGKANAATGKLAADAGLAQVMTDVSVAETGTAVGSVVVKSQPTITLSVANSSTDGSIKYVEEVVGAETAVTVSGTAASAGEHNHGIVVNNA